MALDSANTLSSAILALAPGMIQLTEVTNLVAVIANFMNKIQPGSDGAAGILTFNNASMITILMTQKPVANNSWATIFASGWAAGLSTAIITPGKAMDSSWSGSGTKDTQTVTPGSATISNIPDAQSLLKSGLEAIDFSGAAIPMATAIRNAALSIKFNCIGLGPAPSLTPITVSKTGQ